MNWRSFDVVLASTWEQERYRRVLATPDGLALVKGSIDILVAKLAP
jgi:hypothetical protein